MKQKQLADNGQTKFSLKKPSIYNVIMHNDDVTTMDFVVKILVNIFCMTKDNAETTMMKIHNEGSAVVGEYFLDVAETKVYLTDRLAKENDFPLHLTIKEA